MNECGHFCLPCWIDEKRADLQGWLFRKMPLGWRHRRYMRAAMKMRRRWKESTTTFTRLLMSPREAHRMRRLMRTITQSITMQQSPRYVVRKEERDDRP